MSLVSTALPPGSEDHRLRWIAMVVQLAVPPTRAAEAANHLKAMLPFLEGYPDKAFNRETVVDVAAVERRGGIPMFSEINDVLKAWVRANRPILPPEARLEAPKAPPRSSPTSEAVEHVRRVVESFTGQGPKSDARSPQRFRPEPHPPVRTPEEQLAILSKAIAEENASKRLKQSQKDPT